MTLQKIGPERTAFDGTSFFFNNPVVTGLAGGGYVVVWTDGGDNDPNARRLRAQRYTATGETVGAEIAVNTSSLPQYLADPSVIALKNGGFVIGWSQDSYDAVAQRFNASGAKLGGEFRLNAVQYQGGTAELAELAGGGFVAVYDATDGDVTGVKAQRFGASGARIGPEFIVNTRTESWQEDGAVVGVEGGGFAVAWTDDSRQGLANVRAQLFAADGTRVGGEVIVSPVDGTHRDPVIAALSGGGFVVVWSQRTSGAIPYGNADLVAQIYDAAGVAVGTSFVAGAQEGLTSPPVVTGLGAGGFVVAWTNSPGGGADRDAIDVVARRFDGTGAPLGERFIINTQLAGSQGGPAIDALANGAFVAAWLEDDPMLAGAKYKSQPFGFGPNQPPVDLDLSRATVAERAEVGTLLGVATSLERDAGDPIAYSLVDDAGGAFAIDAATGRITIADAAVLDFETAPSVDLRVRVTDSIGQSYEETFAIEVTDSSTYGYFTGSAKADIFVGDDDAQYNIQGLNGADRLTGADEKDYIAGGNGVDRLFGLGGDDYLVGGLGRDWLAGGSGNDIFFGSAYQVNGDTIEDFAPGDALQVYGFRPAATVTAVYDGAMLTLDDGPGGAKATKVAIGAGYAGAFAVENLGDGLAQITYLI